MNPRQRPEKKRTIPDHRPIGKWVVLAGLVLGLAVFFYFDLGRHVTLTALQENKDFLKTYAQANYGRTVLLFIFMYALQTALSLPGATILTLAGGFLFGTGMGALFVNIGATSGAVLAFMAARTLFRDSIEKKFGKRLAPMQRGFENDAFHYLLTLRLIPLFPFFLVNLSAGLTRMRISTYAAATSIGILPGSLVFTHAGKQLGKINTLKDIVSPGVLGAFVLLGALALLPVLYQKFKKPTAAGADAAKRQ